jgi:hypothetical protein
MSSVSVSKFDGDDVLETLGDVTSILLLASDQHHESEACTTLLAEAAPEAAQYLCVTTDDTPDDRLDEWRANIGELPDETGIIAVGEISRSAAGASESGPGTAPVSIDTVADPSDLTGLAMAIGAYLDAWSDMRRTRVVCFDSITSLLFHTDKERVFRFLHATTGRLRDLGAVAHYHLDPGAFDEATVNMFSSLFDAVVEVEEDGSVSVRTRR